MIQSYYPYGDGAPSESKYPWGTVLVLTLWHPACRKDVSKSNVDLHNDLTTQGATKLIVKQNQVDNGKQTNKLTNRETHNHSLYTDCNEN